MKKIITSILILSTTLLLGCAGGKFTKLEANQLKYEEDTTGSIRQALGKPYREGVITKNDAQFKTLTYAYASTGGKAIYKGVTAARSQGFYFFEDKLVGNEFTSSWAEDATDFDESKVKQIKKGVTTISEVIDIFGAPGGQYIYPLIPEKTEQAKVYMYNQTKGSAFNLKFYHKSLVITYDDTGIVSNIKYTESGNK